MKVNVKVVSFGDIQTKQNMRGQTYSARDLVLEWQEPHAGVAGGNLVHTVSARAYDETACYPWQKDATVTVDLVFNAYKRGEWWNNVCNIIGIG